MTHPPTRSVLRLTRFCLTTSDAPRLASFYEAAFGAARSKRQRVGGAVFERLMGVRGGGARIVLKLGDATVELIEFDEPGDVYPTRASAADPIFQHFAVVVAAMAPAYERLGAAPSRSAITRHGPQTLPAGAGGVTAFKFRDPEGHPLELLAFPKAATPVRWRTDKTDGACLGIDHSAIACADTARSIAFYQRLGLTVSAQTVNRGSEQANLDGLARPRVEVVALTPPDPCPHIELLGYGGATPGGVMRNNDIAATRLVLEGGTVASALSDPDGHRLIIEPAGRDNATFALD